MCPFRKFHVYEYTSIWTVFKFCIPMESYYIYSTIYINIILFIYIFVAIVLNHTFEFFLLTFTYSSLSHLKMDLTFTSPSPTHHLISVFTHILFKSSLHHVLFSPLVFLLSPLQSGVCSYRHSHCLSPLCLPDTTSKRQSRSVLF